MAATDEQLPPAKRLAPQSVSTGFRTGIITAITVLLGFSLAFFRFWGFELPGRWSISSIISTAAIIAAALLQVIALFRALRLEDDDPAEYRKTVKWFIGSAAALVVGLLFAFAESSGVLDLR
jgi:hypothetical protein